MVGFTYIPKTDKTIFVGRLPIISIEGFVFRTYNHHEYGSEWYMYI